MSNRFLELLASRPYLLADGATGTNLFAAGLATGEAPDLWVEQRPDEVKKLHQSFIEAGSDLILTNSFGGTRYRLKLHGAEGRVKELNRHAAELARESADAAGRPVVVAGSMGPTGELIEPLGQLSFNACVDAYAEQAEGLAAGGADILWLETLSSPEELKAAALGASQAGLPLTATLSFDTNGRTMMGVTPAAALELFHSMQPPLAAFGANCGVGAAELAATILGLTQSLRPGEVVIAKGNCGVPSWHEGHIHYSGTPELMAEYARLVRDAGARIIGGCCGTTPAHIRAMHDALEEHQLAERPTVEAVVARLGALSDGTLSLWTSETRSTEPRGRRSRRRGETASS
jgi:5-methyltetrahydrofolate--homocysteine methyltransferase